MARKDTKQQHYSDTGIGITNGNSMFHPRSSSPHSCGQPADDTVLVAASEQLEWYRDTNCSIDDMARHLWYKINHTLVLHHMLTLNNLQTALLELFNVFCMLVEPTKGHYKTL